MHGITHSDLPARAARPSSRSRALLFTVLVIGLGSVPAVAHASSRTERASSFCSKVSAASVSAIIGHSVPAGTPFTDKVKATKLNHEISAVVSSCTYGAVTSTAALAKDVLLSLEVTSRPLTGADLKYSLSQAEKLKITFTPYAGLGVQAFYYTFAESGITVQGMIAIVGKTNYSAGVYTRVPAKSKLAALVRLAEKL